MAKTPKNIKITEQLVITEKENGQVIKTYEVISPFVANINVRKIEAKTGDVLELSDFEASIVNSKVKLI